MSAGPLRPLSQAARCSFPVGFRWWPLCPGFCVMTWQTILRRVAFGLLVPLVGLLLVTALLLGRLAQGPLDVTGLSHRWGEPFAHPGGGTLSWEHMALSWKPRQKGHSAKLLLSMDGVRFRAGAAGGDGGPVEADMPVQTLEHVGVVFKLASLLHGRLGIRSLDVQGLRLTAFRDGEGHFGLGSLKRNAARHGGGGPSLASVMPYHLDLHDIELTVRDETRPDSTMVVALPELKADYAWQTGWQGQVVATIQAPGLGDVPGMSTVRLTGDMAPDGADRTHWKLSVSPFRLPVLASWLPLSPEQEKGLAIPNLPLSFHLEGQLNGRELFGQFDHMDGEMEAGAGEIDRPGKIPFRLTAARSTFQLGPVQAGQAEPLAMTLHTDLKALDSLNRTVPFILDAHGRMDHLTSPREIGLTVDGHVAAFDFATLASVWPDGTAKGARRWMTTNMTAGRGENLNLQLSFTSHSGWGGLDVTKLGGDLVGHGLDITWMDGMQPVTGEDAQARFLDDGRLLIDVQHGHLADGRGGSVAVPTGRIILSGLLSHEQMGDFSLGLEGPLPAFVSVLSSPRLNLLSRNPVNPVETGGTLKGVLSLTLPLRSHIQMKEMSFGAEFDLQKIWLVMPSLGHIQEGWGHLSITDSGLTVKGGAQFRGLVVTGSLFDSFQANMPGRLLLKADLKTPLGAAEFRSFGLPAVLTQESVIQGRGTGHVVYSQFGEGPGHRRGTAFVQADLGGLGVRASSWQKPLGVPAGLQGSISWQDGHMTRLDDIQAYGPQLALRAEGRMRDGQLGGLSLVHFQLGRTTGSAVMDWPLKGGSADGHYQIDVQAGTLDITPWLGGRKAGRSDRETGSAGVRKRATHGVKPVLPPGIWSIGLSAARMIYGKEQQARHVTVSLRWAAQRLQAASFHAAQPFVSFDLSPASGQIGALDVKLSIADFGKLLASTGVYDQLAGGTFELQGHCQPVAAGVETERSMGLGLGLPPFSGRLRVDHMNLENPPAPLVIATLAAPMHWGQLSRRRFEDVQVRASFGVAGGRLDLEEARASNAIAGGTMKGQLDFRQSTLHMQGTLSPFFGVNRAAGSFFGAQKGRGIMSMTYTLGGSLARPEMHVNPFSALVPGVLRRLFE